MGGSITALQTLDCNLSLHKFIEVNFSELMDSNQIFRIDFVWINFHLFENSYQIIECKILDPYDFFEMDSL